jgi:hypothetical protein
MGPPEYLPSGLRFKLVHAINHPNAAILTPNEPQIEDISRYNFNNPSQRVTNEVAPVDYKIRKPQNAWILYRKHMHPVIRAKHPDVKLCAELCKSDSMFPT